MSDRHLLRALLTAIQRLRCPLRSIDFRLWMYNGKKGKNNLNKRPRNYTHKKNDKREKKDADKLGHSLKELCAEWWS